MNQPLRPFLIGSISLYALFLLPSLLLLYYAGPTDSGLSTHMGESWQATLWHFPGLEELPSRVLLDALEAVAIAALGWLFYRGFLGLNAAPTQEQDKNPTLAVTVLLWAALCGGLLIWVTPFHSSDIFGYLNRGFQQSVFHTNPYVTTIAQIPHWQDSHLLHAHWIDNPCPYGFFFARLAEWLTGWAGHSFISAFLLFKTLNWFLLLGTTGLIAHIGARLELKRPWLAAYLFGANPLVLLHAMGNGHNDIAMAFLLMASLACLLSERFRWISLPLLTLSILTKYATLLALPFVVIYLFRQKAYKALLLGAALSFLLTGWLANGYIDAHQPWQWRDMLDNAGKPQHSIISMLESLVYYPLKWLHLPAKALSEGFLKILKPLFWSLFIGFYGWRIFQCLRAKITEAAVFYEIALVTLVMIAFVSAKFHPWYPVMFLPLTLLLPEKSKLRQFTLIFCLFQLAGFTVFQNLPVLNVVILTLVPAWLAWKNTRLFRSSPTD
ncbi:hypothetical protein [Vampirovibrio sp.]|uniref:hypothetical protein n=1 Tax=Vampirovibrio sp. TaxID=2717857 RepID=UPI00359415AC